MVWFDINGSGDSYFVEDNQIEDLSYQQYKPNHPKAPTMRDMFSRLLIPENPLPDHKRDTKEPITITDVDQIKDESPTSNDAKSPDTVATSDSVNHQVNDPVAVAAAAGGGGGGTVPPQAVGAPPPAGAPAAAPAAPASPPKGPAPGPAAAPAPAPAPPPKGSGQPATPPKGPGQPAAAPLPSPPKGGRDTKNQPNPALPPPPTPRQQERPPSEQMPNIPPGGPPPRPQPQLPAKGQAPPPQPAASKPSLSPGSDLGSLGRIGVFGEDSLATHNVTSVPFIHALFLCFVSICFIMYMKRS